MFRYCYLLVALLFFAIRDPLFGQIPDFSKIPGKHEGDSLNITYLINNGTKISNDRVICWFPKDSLSEKRMKEIADMLNTGIREAEKFINAPLDWQVHKGTAPYTYYFRYDRFISHASDAGFVSIPFWRIKEGKAPWLHEVMHEMLQPKTGTWSGADITEKDASENMPLWLFEGLPDYIAHTICVTKNLPWFDVFSNSRRTNIDSLFAEDMRSERGKYVLSFIGSKGIMPELWSKDRSLYAPAFYHGSSLFVKYLVDNYDIKILLAAISSFRQEHEVIEKLTGKSLAVLKKQWLDKLKIE